MTMVFAIKIPTGGQPPGLEQIKLLEQKIAAAKILTAIYNALNSEEHPFFEGGDNIVVLPSKFLPAKNVHERSIILDRGKEAGVLVGRTIRYITYNKFTKSYRIILVDLNKLAEVLGLSKEELEELKEKIKSKQTNSGHAKFGGNGMTAAQTTSKGGGPQ
ncbi:hypothetical protein E3E31_12105 [Thermococcus sp. M39]|uniref:hypothetical protein n=1 Tax=Thermococcus sp. M39 TaxID=1638262 RepID=UPI001438DA00|nr:hypothetical protein [Thermococcus sp. M39]NJE09251.1 hypothetical protein [Thermococcus sp. M39]